MAIESPAVAAERGLSLATEVFLRAGDRCEYCHMPQAAYARKFHLEHITARRHGGATDLDNLALACWCCNWQKGVNLAGIDPQTGEVAPLFHPRKDAWAEHFEMWSGRLLHQGPIVVVVRGTTPQGRATVNTLRMNGPSPQMARTELWREGILAEVI